MVPAAETRGPASGVLKTAYRMVATGSRGAHGRRVGGAGRRIGATGGAGGVLAGHAAGRLARHHRHQPGDQSARWASADVQRRRVRAEPSSVSRLRRRWCCGSGPTAVNLMLGFTLALCAGVLIDTRVSRSVFSRAAFERGQHAGDLAIWPRPADGDLHRRRSAGLHRPLRSGSAEHGAATRALCGGGGAGRASAVDALHDGDECPLSAGRARARLSGRRSPGGRSSDAMSWLCSASPCRPPPVWRCSPQPIAEVLVGETFRDGAAALIPFVAVVVLCRSMATHCLDHAFYLTRRPHLMLRIYAPVGLLKRHRRRPRRVELWRVRHARRRAALRHAAPRP